MGKITPEIAAVVRRLREHPTDTEKLMQAKLRFAGITAVYQFPVVFSEGYAVADFFLPKYGVILELDGGCHATEEQIKKDRQRDAGYKLKGYHVVRLWNSQVDTFHTKSLTAFKKIKPEKEQKPDKITQKKRRIRKEYKSEKARRAKP
jgi:very-short-patch-repair endonuclease